MAAHHENLITRWFEEVWNQGKESAIDELTQPEVQCFGFPEPDSVLNLDQFKAAYRQFRSNFSDIHVVVDDVIGDGDRMAGRWRCSATHTGDGLGFAATGKKITFAGSSFVEARDGRILKGWNHLDFTTVVQKLQMS